MNRVVAMMWATALEALPPPRGFQPASFPVLQALRDVLKPYLPEDQSVDHPHVLSRIEQEAAGLQFEGRFMDGSEERGRYVSPRMMAIMGYSFGEIASVIRDSHSML
jgi:hypothetical protein